MVGENVLFHLDKNGKRITGDLAQKYALKKNRMDPLIENTKWLLAEVMGQKVASKEESKEAFLMLNSEEGRYSGNNSCNVINGAYELQEDNRISFGQGMSTLMACPNETTAKAFSEMLSKAHNYSLSDDLFVINNESMEALASFKKSEG